MFRTIRKAVSSLEQGLETAFSAPPTSHSSLSFGPITVRLGRVIAEGGFSFIHVATPISSNYDNTSTTVRYAVKRISYSESETKRLVEHEISFLNNLKQSGQHKNIVKYYGSTIENDEAFLLFELIDGGTLPERLKQKKIFNHEEILNIFSDIVTGVAFIHSLNLTKPYSIRDIKLENVLYDRIEKCYKLCDFGSVNNEIVNLSKCNRNDILKIEEDVSQNCTTMYCAPELVDLYSGYIICEKVDIWSLGCIFYALLFHNLPFDGSSTLQITNGLQNIPTNTEYPSSFIQILKSCFVINPIDRPDIFALLSAIRRTQNKPLENHLVAASQRIRRLRNSDFGRPSSSIEIDVHVNNSTSTNYTPTHDQNEDWADFSSAFGSEASTNFNNQSASSSIINNSNMSSSTMPNPRLQSTSSSSEFVPDQQQQQSLIDFSDMIPTSPKSTKNQSRSAHADDQTDLINMFSKDAFR